MSSSARASRSRSGVGNGASRTGRRGLSGLLAAELIKLKRSSSWVIAVLLPLLAVVTGTINYTANSQALPRGWESLTSQVMLFYSMLFFSIGVALLASMAWRVEHQGTWWNAMRASGHSATAVVAAKTLVVVVPVAAMQMVLGLLTYLSGATIGGLGAAPPVGWLGSCAVAVLAALPLIAWQSLLSMLMRSFAAPVAAGFVGCVAGVGLLYSSSPVASAVPQGLIMRALTLGTTAVSDAGDLALDDVLPILAWAGAGAAVAWLALLAVARRTGGVR